MKNKPPPKNPSLLQESLGKRRRRTGRLLKLRSLRQPKRNSLSASTLSAKTVNSAKINADLFLTLSRDTEKCGTRNNATT